MNGKTLRLTYEKANGEFKCYSILPPVETFTSGNGEFIAKLAYVKTGENQYRRFNWSGVKGITNEENL